MPSGSAVSTNPDAVRAAEEAAGRVAEALGGGATLAFAFLSPHHRGREEKAAEALCRILGTRALVGCSGAGVLADGREVEDQAAVAVMAASFPGAEARTFHLSQEDLEAETPDWPALLGAAPEEMPSFVLLPDPYSIDAMRLLPALDAAYPEAVKVGGMSSGGHGPGQHALILGSEVHREGAVGLALVGAAEILPLVSQGCRPVGPRMVITKGERNVIRELAGKPALACIRDTLQALPARDQELASTALMIGRVVDEAKAELHRGDFLIRGLVGADENTGAVAVGDLIRRGQTIELQVRDALTADEDLRALLDLRAKSFQDRPPAGALLFSCNGRGIGMYGEPDHDSKVLRESLPGLPLAGFFCNGEIGPVGPHTFLHGFTSSIGFLVAR